MKSLVCSFLFLTSSLFCSAYMLELPKSWECIDDPSQLPNKVKVVYIGKGKETFTPSINLACEATGMPLSDYVSLAKNYHASQSHTHVRELGQVATNAGSASLIQIDQTTKWGDVRFLQATLVIQGQAYVITATALKNEFGKFSPHFLRAIQSFQIPLGPPEKSIAENEEHLINL